MENGERKGRIVNENSRVFRDCRGILWRKNEKGKRERDRDGD